MNNVGKNGFNLYLNKIDKILQENPEAFKLTVESVKLGIPLRIIEGHARIYKERDEKYYARDYLTISNGDDFILLANRSDSSYYVHVFDRDTNGWFGYIENTYLGESKNKIPLLIVREVN